MHWQRRMQKEALIDWMSCLFYAVAGRLPRAEVLQYRA